MKTEVSIQLLKFCFQVFNCILLVSGTWDTGEDPGSDVDLRLSPVPLQVLGVSVLSCSLWILFSPGNLLNVLPSGNTVVGDCCRDDCGRHCVGVASGLNTKTMSRHEIM